MLRTDLNRHGIIRSPRILNPVRPLIPPLGHFKKFCLWNYFKNDALKPEVRAESNRGISVLQTDALPPCCRAL